MRRGLTWHFHMRRETASPCARWPLCFEFSNHGRKCGVRQPRSGLAGPGAFMSQVLPSRDLCGRSWFSGRAGGERCLPRHDQPLPAAVDPNRQSQSQSHSARLRWSRVCLSNPRPAPQKAAVMHALQNRTTVFSKNIFYSTLNNLQKSYKNHIFQDTSIK